MKRFRLSTLLLLVVIAALCLALVVQHDRASRREKDYAARERAYAAKAKQFDNAIIMIKKLEESVVLRRRPSTK